MTKSIKDINMIVLSTLLFFLGMFFPYGFPLVSLVIVLFFVMKLSKINEMRLPFSFLSSVWLPLIVLFLIAYPISSQTRFSVLDFSDIISFSLYLMLLGFIFQDKEKRNLFYTRFTQCLFYMGSFFAIVGLIKFGLLSINIQIPFFYTRDGVYPWGTSLRNDYNVYSRALIFAAISGYYNIRRSSRLISSTKLFLLLCTVAAVLLSGSRSSFLIMSGLVLLVIAKIMIKRIPLFLVSLTRMRLLYAKVVFLLVVFMMVCGLFLTHGIGQSEFKRISRRIASFTELSFSAVNDRNPAESRTSRWSAAFYLYSESTVIQMVFGRGHQYLYDMGAIGKSDSGKDYPHNLLLSVLLSNGIIGFFYYFFLIVYILRTSFYHRFREYFFFVLVILSTRMISGDQIMTSIYSLYMLLIPLYDNAWKHIDHAKQIKKAL